MKTSHSILKLAAIVPAAGFGKRMGQVQEKQFLDLYGEPIIVRTLKNLAQSPKISEIYLMMPPDKIAYCQKELVDKYNVPKIAAIVAGGRERQDSVANGIACLDGEQFNLVLVHDGVRPLVSQSVIDRTIVAAQKSGAAVAAIPVKDTIKEVDSDGNVIQTLERHKLWAIQTPQVFHYKILKEAFDKAAKDGFYGTDEASVVEYMGQPVQVVKGDPANIKITTPEDMILARAFINEKY